PTQAAPATPVPTALEAAAAALSLLRRPHLVERPLHGLGCPGHLPLVEGLLALHHLLAPVALASRPRTGPAPQTVHLLEQLAKLLGGELARVDTCEQAPGLPEHHLVGVLGEVLLKVREAVDALEETDAVVTLLEERVEVWSRAGHLGVLEGRRQVTFRLLAIRARA